MRRGGVRTSNFPLSSTLRMKDWTFSKGVMPSERVTPGICLPEALMGPVEEKRFEAVIAGEVGGLAY